MSAVVDAISGGIHSISDCISGESSKSGTDEIVGTSDNSYRTLAIKSTLRPISGSVGLKALPQYGALFRTPTGDMAISDEFINYSRMSSVYYWVSTFAQTLNVEIPNEYSSMPRVTEINHAPFHYFETLINVPVIYTSKRPLVFIRSSESGYVAIKSVGIEGVNWVVRVVHTIPNSANLQFLVYGLFSNRYNPNNGATYGFEVRTPSGQVAFSDTSGEKLLQIVKSATAKEWLVNEGTIVRSSWDVSTQGVNDGIFPQDYEAYYAIIGSTPYTNLYYGPSGSAYVKKWDRGTCGNNGYDEDYWYYPWRSGVLGMFFTSIGVVSAATFPLYSAMAAHKQRQDKGNFIGNGLGTNPDGSTYTQISDPAQVEGIYGVENTTILKVY
jgi:hypothetical protein